MTFLLFVFVLRRWKNYRRNTFHLARKMMETWPKWDNYRDTKVSNPSGSIRTLSYCSREMTWSGPFLERSFYGIPIYQKSIRSTTGELSNNLSWPGLAHSFRSFYWIPIHWKSITFEKVHAIISRSTADKLFHIIIKQFMIDLTHIF